MLLMNEYPLLINEYPLLINDNNPPSMFLLINWRIN